MRNWAGNITFGAARVHRPATLDELRGAVAGAPGRVRVLGSGHSFNRIADTDGDLVLLDGLPPSVEVDAAAGTATVAAGMRYAEVAAALHARGWALANLASLPHISVAGSVATGTHGSGTGNRSLSAAVTAVELVGPGGAVTELSRAADPARFPGAVVAIGALGAVTRLTLAVEPAYRISQWVYDGVPLDALAADGGLDAALGAAYSVSAFTRWSPEDPTATVWRKHRGAEPRPAAEWLGGRAADGPRHPIPGLPPEFCTEQLGAPGPWHERLPHFRPDFTPSNGDELQSEWFLPREAAPAALPLLRGLGARLAPVLQVSEIRAVAADDLWLSPAEGRDSVAFHFTWSSDFAAVRPVVAAVDAALAPLGARPHWAKVTTLAPADIVARYPKAAAFRELLAELDPAGVFRNAYVDALFPGDTPAV